MCYIIISTAHKKRTLMINDKTCTGKSNLLLNMYLKYFLIKYLEIDKAIRDN